MDEFDYELSDSSVAQTPVEPRDAARLLVSLDGGRAPEHRHVSDLAAYLRSGDLLVVNNTRVLPARLRLRKSTGGETEVLLLEPVGDGDHAWEALVKPGRRLPDGTRLFADEVPVLEVTRKLDSGRRVVTFLVESPRTEIEQLGEIPLPPYIHSPLADPERYQTVYSDSARSVAAPTAGLHLTRELIERCLQAGAEIATVDLVVGLDTFRPIVADDPSQHVMHSERYEVTQEVLERCRAAKRVVAIGTTTVRALESAARGSLSGRTDLFIRRGYEFQLVDVLMTNFHLPRSSLLLLVDAFYGPKWRLLYEEALEQGYRFFSFGDAMLLGMDAGR